MEQGGGDRAKLPQNPGQGKPHGWKQSPEVEPSLRTPPCSSHPSQAPYRPAACSRLTLLTEGQELGRLGRGFLLREPSLVFGLGLQ